MKFLEYQKASQNGQRIIFSEDRFIEYVKNTHRSEIQRKRGGKGGKLSNSGGRPKGSFNINSYNFKKRMGVFRC